MARFGFVLLALIATIVSVPAAARATTAPVAAYGFEDSGTTVGDSSNFSNNGTVLGGATRAAGKFGNAISLDGVNDMVKVPDAGTINLASTMTVEAWVKPSA